MKIKVKDFNGILTNNDENDNRLEYCTDSENFYHKRGFLEIDPRNLAEITNLPDPNNDLGNYTWAWETGIYTTLTNDVLSTRDIPEPAKHDVLVLIAKANDSGTYHRLVYLYDYTNSDGWYELSNKGNYISVGGEPIIDIENHNTVNFLGSAMSTSIDGTTHFQVENGRLKIYMPHDAFWVGKLDRKIWIHDDAHRWPIIDTNGDTTYPHFDYENNYWYIDRVVDRWKHNKQMVAIANTANELQFPRNPLATSIECAKGHVVLDDQIRRTGLYYDMIPNETQTHVVGGKEISIGQPHDLKVRKETEWSNFRCLRVSIYDEDGFAIANPKLPFPAYPEIWLFPLDATRTDSGVNTGTGDWDIDAGSGYGPPNWTGLYIHLHGADATNFRLASGSAWSTEIARAEGAVKVWNAETAQFTGGTSLSISVDEFLNNTVEYAGDAAVSSVGWETTENDFSIVVTAVLDEREEFLIGAENFKPEVADKYVIGIKNIQMPWDINKRITRLRFYHKLKDATDYEMVKDFDLLSSESTIENFDISTEAYDGIFLAANIGYLLDYYDHKADYRLITGFTDFVTESGISIGVASKDEVAIYHSTYGGGNLMPDLIYDDNRLPITGVSQLTAVANADGRLMAFTAHTSYVVQAEEVGGVIAFRFMDTVEIGAKNKNDVVNIQGGVLVHSEHGIYVTNGFETKSISEAIDDIIATNYATGRIYYNRYKHEVYYKPAAAEDLYRYRMKDNVWEHMEKTKETAVVS
jgi:hypothetical protein